MIRGWMTKAWRRTLAVAVVGLMAATGAPAVPQETATPATTPPPVTQPATTPELRPYVPERKPDTVPAPSGAAPAAPRPVKPKPAATTGSASSSSASAASSRPAPVTAAPQNAARPSTQAVAQTSSSAAPAPRTPVVTTQPIPVTARVPGAPISADDIETFTDSVVRSWMQRDHVVGVTVAVVQGNTPLLLKGYGYDRLTPVRRVDPSNSLFRIGSITKTFTWIVARQEIEAGRIKPDASLAEYDQDGLYAEDARYKPVTMNSLMAHAAGYEDTSLGHLFTLDERRLASPGYYLNRHRAHRVRDPGEFSSYSNYDAALAAAILAETAKAKDVPSLMEARVFSPLGMDHTTLREPYANANGEYGQLPVPLGPELTQDLSDGYIWDGATYRAQPFDHAISQSGALGGSSTARDMARFMSLMLGNGQLDGLQLYDANSAAAFRKPIMTMPEGYNGWASGLMIRTSPSGHVTYGHGGATLWFNSSMVLVPDMNLGIFISTNTQTGGPLANAFPNLLLDHLDGDLVRPPLMPSPAQAYEQHRDYYNAIKGQYVSTRRAYTGLEGAITRLINTIRIGADGDGRLIMDTSTGTSAFVPAQANGFFLPQDSEDPGPAGELGGLHFLFNPDGTHVTAFETASNMMRYERVGWVHSPEFVGLLARITLLTCLMVIVSRVFALVRGQRATEHQFRAAWISVAISLLWITAILLFNDWLTKVSDDPASLLIRWPSPELIMASALALLATIGIVLQIGTYYFVYVEAKRFSVADGWAHWQKLTHGALLAYWSLFAVVLGLWGALEPW